MAVASLIIALVVAAGVLYREWIHALLFRPKLHIEFSLETPISRETTIVWPPEALEPSRWKKAFWPRIRLINKGRSVAQRCEGILAEVRTPDGTLDKRYDPLTLRWAIAPTERGLEPIDIARGRQVDLNIFTTVENEANAPFATYPHARGIPLSLGPGDYWLRIIIYGDNFKPVERGYAVHWDGTDYRGIQMQEMNERPSSTTPWPYELLITANSNDTAASDAQTRGAEGEVQGGNGVKIVPYVIGAIFLLSAVLSFILWYAAFSHNLDSTARESIRYGSCMQFIAALMGLFVAITSYIEMPANIHVPWFFKVLKRRVVAFRLLLLALILFLGGIVVQVLGTGYFSQP